MQFRFLKRKEAFDEFYGFPTFDPWWKKTINGKEYISKDLVITFFILIIFLNGLAFWNFGYKVKVEDKKIQTPAVQNDRIETSGDVLVTTEPENKIVVPPILLKDY